MVVIQEVELADESVNSSVRFTINVLMIIAFKESQFNKQPYFANHGNQSNK